MSGARWTARARRWSRGAALLGVGLLLAAGVYRFGGGFSPAKTAGMFAAHAGAPRPVVTRTAAQKTAAVTGAMPSAAGPMRDRPAADNPAAERQLWQERLRRAEERLAAYRSWARYPPDARPASEHPDRLQPTAPITRILPLRHAPGAQVRLQLTQERLSLVGSESARLSVRCEDGQGALLPCTVQTARALPLQPPSPQSAPPPPAGAGVRFADDGRSGDEVAGDGTWSAMVQPARLGFGGYLGPLRVELLIGAGAAAGGPPSVAEASDAVGEAAFELWYTPEPPAVLTGQVREEVSDGSLQLYLGIDVRTAGRYVLAARVDDARGKSFAYLEWNEELAPGLQEIKLTVFGKLILDLAPTMPLRLRDVDGFLLKEDAEPDREYLPLLAGYVHTTGSHPHSGFSDEPWRSEERDRDEKQLAAEVEQARHALLQLGEEAPPMKAPGLGAAQTPAETEAGPQGLP